MIRNLEAPRASSGFSLIEMVVTVAILGISLSVLYQAAGGATRAIGVDEKYAYGVELARSLMADHAVVPDTGLSVEGSTAGGFEWTVTAAPVPVDETANLAPGALQGIVVEVAWDDGNKRRQVNLHSVVAGRDAQP